MSLTFGPIPSRRFGMSLGIDLSPDSKQCNFDCLYCELKPASTVSNQTSSPKVSDVINEVKQSLVNHPNINVITLTANGEPTLYPYLDELVDELDNIKGDIKTLILSNAGNIYKQEIQQTLKKIDIVKLSLDCVSSKCFKKLDRTNNEVDCTKIVDGMISFRKIYDKELVCELLIVKDLNDNDEEIMLLNDAFTKIQPNRIDIGTIDRPPAYNVQPVSFEVLSYIANKFTNLSVNIAHKNRPKQIQSFNQDEIVGLLTMRPLTKDDIDNTFDNNSKNILNSLVKNQVISVINSGGVEFYKFVGK